MNPCGAWDGPPPPRPAAPAPLRSQQRKRGTASHPTPGDGIPTGPGDLSPRRWVVSEPKPSVERSHRSVREAREETSGPRAGGVVHTLRARELGVGLRPRLAASHVVPVSSTV